MDDILKQLLKENHKLVVQALKTFLAQEN